MTSMTAPDVRIEREIAALGDLLREELAARWMKAYGCAPPKGVKRCLLERAAAWYVQAKYLGGLSPMVRKAIRDAVRLGKDDSYASAKPGHTAQTMRQASLPMTGRPGRRT